LEDIPVDTPLGSLEVSGSWVESTVTTVRLPNDDPRKAMTIVFKRYDLSDGNVGGGHEREKQAIVESFGDTLTDEGESTVTFLDDQRPCFRYSFPMGDHEVTQALVTGICPYGAYTATATALRGSFDEHWPALEMAIASFRPRSQG
jgi:hypothetical protein